MKIIKIKLSQELIKSHKIFYDRNAITEIKQITKQKVPHSLEIGGCGIEPGEYIEGKWVPLLEIDGYEVELGEWNQRGEWIPEKVLTPEEIQNLEKQIDQTSYKLSDLPHHFANE